MDVKKMLLFVLMTIFFSEQAYSWTVKSREELIEGKEGLKGTILKFKDAGQTYEYRPHEAPYFMTLRKIVRLEDGRNILLTRWSKGAASVSYRVFGLSENLNEPICEVVSMSDELEYRAKKKGIQIKLLVENFPKLKYEWVDCYRDSRVVPDK